MGPLNLCFGWDIDVLIIAKFRLLACRHRGSVRKRSLPEMILVGISCSAMKRVGNWEPSSHHPRLPRAPPRRKIAFNGSKGQRIAGDKSRPKDNWRKYDEICSWKPTPSGRIGPIDRHRQSGSANADLAADSGQRHARGQKCLQRQAAIPELRWRERLAAACLVGGTRGHQELCAPSVRSRGSRTGRCVPHGGLRHPHRRRGVR